MRVQLVIARVQLVLYAFLILSDRGVGVLRAHAEGSDPRLNLAGVCVWFFMVLMHATELGAAWQKRGEEKK